MHFHCFLCGSFFVDILKGELQSYLIEITRNIFMVKTEVRCLLFLSFIDAFMQMKTIKQINERKDGKAYVVDTVLDKTGMKGTGTWTVADAAKQGHSRFLFVIGSYNSF
jgi:6-phosphogluconate dehydrogenase